MSHKMPKNDDARMLLAIAERELMNGADAARFTPDDEEKVRKHVREAIEQVEAAHLTLMRKRRFTDPDHDLHLTLPRVLHAGDPRLRRLWDMAGVLNCVAPVDLVSATPTYVPVLGAERVLPFVIDRLRDICQSLGFSAPTPAEIEAWQAMVAENDRQAREDREKGVDR